MRLLYISSVYKPAYVYGGPSRSVPSLCEGLVEAGMDVEVFTTNANRGDPLDVPLGTPTLVDGVPVNYFPLVSERYFHAPSLVEAVRRRIQGFDIVEIDALFSSLLEPVARVCRNFGAPYVVPPRGQLMLWALREKRWKKSVYLRLAGLRTLNAAAAIHCTDPVEADALPQAGVKAPAFVVPNGVELRPRALTSQAAGLRHMLGIPEAAPLLLFVGRFHRVKRLDIAIATLGALPSAHLLLAGPDEENLEPLLRKQASCYGCAGRLHVLPLQTGDCLQGLYSSADLFVLPSEMESFGMAAAEAMAAGLPVLVSDNVPVGRWAQASRAGMMAANQADTFAGAARALLALPREELLEMGIQARRCAECYFDRAAVARMFIDRLCALRKPR